MRVWAIRHKPTGQFMPEARGNKGYTHWNPWKMDQGGVQFKRNSIRFFFDLTRTKVAATRWLQGPYGWHEEECGEVDMFTGSCRIFRAHDPDPNRKESDLEIVEFKFRELYSEEHKIAGSSKEKKLGQKGDNGGGSQLDPSTL